MNKDWMLHILWIAAAGIMGFFIPFVFSRVLRLPREIYLIPFVVIVSAFLLAYVRWSKLDVLEIVRHHWAWGLVGALVLSPFLVKSILSQPISPHTSGGRLALDILWQGVVYGALDGLLLSVFPIVATWQAFSLLGWTAAWPGKISVGVMGLAASLLLTAVYHLGYIEYAGTKVAAPVFGNSMMSIAYLLTNNPISAVASHIAMHVAGVLHGPESVLQLPPHY